METDTYSDSRSRTPPPPYEDAATFVYTFDYLPTLSAPPFHDELESVVITMPSHEPANQRQQQQSHLSELRNYFYCVC